MNHSDTRPTNVRWLVFALGCGTSWILYLHRYAFALIKPDLQREFGWSNTQLGELDSAFSLCYSILQFPAGAAADLFGLHLFLGGSILLWSLGLGMHAWAPSLGWMQMARGAFGAGQSGVLAMQSRLTRTWFPLSVRTTVQGWLGVFASRLGGVSANLLVATLLLGLFGLPWRTAIYLLAAVGISHGLVFLLAFRNSPRQHPLVNEAEAELIDEGESPSKSGKQRMGLRTMLGRASVRSTANLMFLTVASIMSTFADNIYSNWIPLFLASEHGLNFKEMGIYSALPLLGGACGGAFGGMLNDRLIRRTGNRRWTRSLIGFGGKTLAGIVLVVALLAYYDNPYVFCGLLFVVKFFADSSLAARWGTITDIGGRATATIFALNNSLAGIGSVLAPLVYGRVADMDNYSWPWVFIIAGLAYGVCAASWLLVDCTIPVLREKSEDGAKSESRR